MSEITVTPTLQTERLILRPLALSDAPAIQRHFNNSNIIQHLAQVVPWPYPENGAETLIARELERVRRQSGMLLTVDRYDNLLRSGRVSRGEAWLGSMLDVKPVLSLDPEGRVVPVDRVRGREQLISRVLALLERRLTPRPAVVRFGVVHTGALDVAERVRTALVAAYRPRDCFLTLATGVLGTHVGEGAWAIFYQVEDGTPARLDAAPAGIEGSRSMSGRSTR